MTELEPPLMTVLLNRSFLPGSSATRRSEGGRARTLEDAAQGARWRAAGTYLPARGFTVADLNVHRCSPGREPRQDGFGTPRTWQAG